MSDVQRFADLGRPRRIWAVAAIHADAARLNRLHAALGGRFRVGDRIVYLGNMVGRGAAPLETIDALLAFRRWILSHRGALAGDVVFLRGGQEEMWRGLLQLHFAPNPVEVLEWSLNNGAGPMLAAYGADPAQGFAAARGGAVSATRWTQVLRTAFYGRPGHESLFGALKRAAYVGAPVDAGSASAAARETAQGTAGEGGNASAGGGPLFVHAGIDPSRGFAAQGDRFWWGGRNFAALPSGFCGFSRVVRGFDPIRGGAGKTGGLRAGDDVGHYAVTLDAGCGFGGPLTCCAFTADGQMVDSVQI